MKIIALNKYITKYARQWTMSKINPYTSTMNTVNIFAHLKYEHVCYIS